MKNTLLKLLAAALVLSMAVCAVSACDGDTGSNGGSSKSDSDNNDNDSDDDDDSDSDSDDDDDSDSDSDDDDDSDSDDDSGFDFGDDDWGWGESSEAVTVDPKTVDYSNIDITIPWDSGEEIVTFTNDMLAGAYDGKVVKCEGICQRRMFGNAMMQEQEDGSSRGFTWYIVDSTSEDDYPPEDSRVEIVGVVGIGEYDVRYVYVLPENINIIDDNINID